MESEESQLDQRQEQILERARSALGPNETQRSMGLNRLSATLLAPAANGGSVENGGHAGGVGASTAKVAAISVRAFIAGTSTALVVGLLGGYWAGTHAQPDVVTSNSPLPADLQPNTVESASPLPEPTSTELQPKDSVDHEKTGTPPLGNDPESSAPNKAKRALHSTGKQQVEAELTFYGELSYLKRAQAALRDQNGALALGLMDSLDKKPNKGALWAERQVTRTLALCQLGRVDEATQVAGNLIKREGARAYRKRLLASCAGSQLGKNGSSP